MKLKLTKIFLWVFALCLFISYLGGMLSSYTTSFQSELRLDKENKRSIRHFYLHKLELCNDTGHGALPYRQKEFVIATHEAVPFHIDVEYNKEIMTVLLEKHEISPNEKVKMTVKFFEKKIHIVSKKK